MPNIARILKEEISRLARREVRSGFEKNRKSLAQHQREIASLKKEVKALQRQVAAIARTAARPTTGAAVQTETRQRRFVPKGLVSTRKRLGLSAAELASLLGVTAQTIYNWERGATRPGPELHSKLVALRGVGKREVTAHLATLRQASTG